MHDEIQRGAKVLTPAHGGAQLVHRAQRAHAGGHQQAVVGVGPEGGYVRRGHAEVVDHVVDHGQQRVFLALDARGVRALAQRLEEIVGQAEVGLHPALAGAVRQVEMQPQERPVVGAGMGHPGILALQPGHRLGGRNLARRLPRLEQEPADEPHRIGTIAGFDNAGLHKPPVPSSTIDTMCASARR
ncbi:hypothetical protein D3C81_1293090 [compost metagenome]